MSIRYNDYDAESGRSAVEAEGGAPEREISLGTTTVLGIFLGLATVCAVFFGFGYSMGRKSVPSPLADVNTGVSAPLPENRLTPGSLPGAGSAGGGYVPPTVRSGGAEGATDGDGSARSGAGQRGKPAASGAATGAETPNSVEAVERRQVARAVDQANGVAPAAPRAAVPQASPGTAAALPTAGAGATYVQVTAISIAHRADADMLVASLRKKGYPAAIHAGATDGLLHVQLGPFATKKDAEAVRGRLSGDGYNSILK